MSLSLLFCHGWGFDASEWDPLAALLPEFPQARDDAGYFGTPVAPHVPAPVVAVTHSFGTMRLLAAPPPGLVGLVAIAGFDRFTAAEGFPGMQRRFVDRMVSAVAQAPETVLADFRDRCGSDAPVPAAIDAARLQSDLVALRDDDRRMAAMMLGLPVLSLQAGADPILSVAMRETVFANVPGVMRRTHPSAGHLLASQEPGWCAEAIRAFAGTLG